MSSQTRKDEKEERRRIAVVSVDIEAVGNTPAAGLGHPVSVGVAVQTLDDQVIEGLNYNSSYKTEAGETRPGFFFVFGEPFAWPRSGAAANKMWWLDPQKGRPAMEHILKIQKSAKQNQSPTAWETFFCITTVLLALVTAVRAFTAASWAPVLWCGGAFLIALGGWFAAAAASLYEARERAKRLYCREFLQLCKDLRDKNYEVCVVMQPGAYDWQWHNALMCQHRPRDGAKEKAAETDPDALSALEKPHGFKPHYCISTLHDAAKLLGLPPCPKTRAVKQTHHALDDAASQAYHFTFHYRQLVTHRLQAIPK